jgi:hypothetical protein
MVAPFNFFVFGQTQSFCLNLYGLQPIILIQIQVFSNKTKEKPAKEYALLKCNKN